MAASCRAGSHHEAAPSCMRTGAGQRGPHLRGNRRQVGGAHRGRVDPHGQRDGVAALEARERVHDRVAGRRAVERHAGARGQDDGLQAVQDDRRVAVRAVDGPRHPADLEDERPLEHARRRRDVGAEDAHADPAETADRADAVALVERQLDGGAPVGLDAEADRLQPPVVPAGGEGRRAPPRARWRARSSFVRASPAVSPPTLTPSILTPAAIRSGEPAKTNPSTAPPTAATIASTTSRCASSALERLRRRLRTRTGPVPASTRKVPV